MGHRLLAYLAFATVVVIAIAGVKSQAPRIRTLSWIALALGVAQIALGVATVLSGLEPVLRSVHQANGALLFATLVLLASEAYAAPVEQTALDVSTHATPAAPQRV